MTTTKIPAELVAVNAIQGTLIADNAITSVHIAQNNITTTQIATNNITSEAIAQNNVTAVHILQNTITVTHLADSAVETAKINADAVTGAKLADNAVDSEHYTDGSIDTAHIGDLQVTAAKIGANAVTLAKMASLARGSILIGNSAADVTALAIGSNGTALVSDGTDISWGSAGETNRLPLAGGTLTGDLILGDNVKIEVGSASGGDLQIYHDGSNSYIEEAGTGNLYIKSNADNYINLTSAAADANLGLVFRDSGGTQRGYLLFDSDDYVMTFGTSAERMRITSGGDILIGQTSQTGYTFAQKLVVGDGDANDGITIQSGSTHQGNLAFNHSDGTTAYGRILYQHNTNYMSFMTNNAERVRIHSDGDTNIGGYLDAPTDNGRLVVQSGATCISAYVGNTGFASKVLMLAVEATNNNSNYHFAEFYSGRRPDNGGGDMEFKFRGDGNAYADASWNASGADYAEYFEWSDGNGSSQDRIGLSVVLDGNKIREATGSDSADNIIGVISGNAAVVGDTSFDKWTGKYEKDDYGRYVYENYVDENGDTLKRRKLNASYDDSLTYVEREKRKEWDTVGLMGKLRMKKGQQTGTNWIKMRDISASVEEWLVR